LDVEIQFLEDIENPLFKTEVLRFGGPDPEGALEALEADPKISELFASIRKQVDASQVQEEKTPTECF